MKLLRVRAIIEDIMLESQSEVEAVVLPLLPLAILEDKSVNSKHLPSVLLSVALNASLAMKRNAPLRNLYVVLLPLSLVNPLLLLPLKFVLSAILSVICVPLLLLLISTGSINALMLAKIRFFTILLNNYWLVYNVLLLVLVENFGTILNTILLFGKLNLLNLVIVERKERTASASLVL